MIGKKINQLATELAPTTTDLTIIGDPVTGVSKKITLEQLGAIFGGAVSFYTTLGDFPVTGVIDIIYCAKDTQKLYLWSGSAYVEVFPSQSLLDTYQLRSEKGVSNGYASLDVNGKVPIGQLPNSIMEYKGTWNAATNTPTLANGTGDTGDVYICNVAGTVNFGAGPITFAVGDYTVYSGSIWQRSSGAVGTVTSVAVSNSGDALAITGSPITTSGTINIGFAGTGAQYIKGDGTLATFPNTIAQAQNLITEVYNNTGATLTKGTIVYINGGQGNLPTVTKALATSDATSAQTYGVVQTDITNMNNGYVVVEGRLSDLDTQAYANGTQLYLSPTTAGTWTSTKPYAPNHLVYVGIVVRSHPTQGVVEVKIMNGFEMDELHNVAAQSPDNNDILQYKTATSLWTKVAGTTSNIAEGSNLYYTDARSRAALSFTAGSGAYNSTTGVITIPTNTNQLTNGASFITLASLSAGAGISYNNTTGVIASTITQYTDALARAAISLTTTGTSGAATYNNTTGVLNIPQYQTALTNPVTGTGTTNYLPKFTGASTIGNSTIREISGQVGIGITPTGSWGLQIFGNGTANTVARIQLQNTSTGSADGDGGGISMEGNDFVTRNNESGVVKWELGGSQRMELTNSGNLGLGVTPSAWSAGGKAIEIGMVGSAHWGLDQTSTYRTTNAYWNSGWKYGGTGQAANYAQEAGSHYWSTAPSGTAGNAISFTQAMTLDASGRLALGRTSADHRLDVQGNILVRNTLANASFYLAQEGDNSSTLYQYNNGTLKNVIATNGNSYFTGGNVGIGTNNPTNILHLLGGDSLNSTLKIQASTYPIIDFISNDTASANNRNWRIAGVYNAYGTFEILSSTTQGGAPTTSRFAITNSGVLTIGNQNVSGNYFLNITPSTSSISIQGILAGTGAAKIVLQPSGGDVEITSGSIKTGAPTNGTAQPWKLGNAVSGTVSPSHYLVVEINGQSYTINAFNGFP